MTSYPQRGAPFAACVVVLTAAAGEQDDVRLSQQGTVVRVSDAQPR